MPGDSPRIALVEDDDHDAELIRRELQRAGVVGETVRVQNEGDLIRALRQFQPDIVLSDHSLPQFNARDALRVVHRERPGTPVIIVTGSLDEETAAEYIKAGAADYIVKHRLHRLGPAVGRALALQRAQQQATEAAEARARNEEQLRQANIHLQTVIESSPLAIFSIDPDGFVRTWNPAAERLFGWTAREVLGTSLPIVPDEKRGEFSDHRRRVS